MLDIDYQILKIIFKNRNQARLKQIQNENLELTGNKIPLSTLNSCLERLEKNDYIKWIRYSPPMLTEKGKHLAIELIRHAQLLEVLLYNELEIDPEEAHRESEKLNLIFSCNIVQKICEKYNHPATCPCGDEILNSRNCSCVEFINEDN
jgi:Mn-dependent DtxR family transcriptional regulator